MGVVTPSVYQQHVIHPSHPHDNIFSTLTTNQIHPNHYLSSQQHCDPLTYSYCQSVSRRQSKPISTVSPFSNPCFPPSNLSDLIGAG